MRQLGGRRACGRDGRVKQPRLAREDLPQAVFTSRDSPMSVPLGDDPMHMAGQAGAHDVHARGPDEAL